MKRHAMQFVLLVCLAFGACSRDSVPARSKPSDIAVQVVSEVGKSGVVVDTGKGAPIVVFEEDHGSVTGQMQQAVMLTRLHQRYGPANVVLESYSEGSLDDGALNVRKAIAGGVSEDIAASLLSEGEISAVEFLKITQPGIVVTKGEKSSTGAAHDQQQKIEYLLTTKLALGLIAIDNGSVTEADASAYFKTLNSSLPIQTVQQFEAVINGADGLMAQDPWARAQGDLLFPKGVGGGSIEAEAKALDEVIARVQKLPDEFSGLVSSIAQFKSFLAARSAASDEMVAAALQIAQDKNTRVVAMIIGAAHTDKVAQLIQAANVPYAVIRSAAMDSTLDVRLSARNYDAKMKGRTVGATLGSFLDRVPNTQIAVAKFKPAPVLQQEWLSTKAELYSKADTLGRLLVQGGGSGSGGGEPPITTALAGFSDDFFRGKYFYIDRSRITVSRESGRNVLSFAIQTTNTDKEEKAKTLWVKLALSDSERPADGSTSRSEGALRDALEDLQRRGAKDGEKLGKAEPAGNAAKSHEQVVLRPPLLAGGFHVEQIRVSKNVHMIVSESELATKSASFRL